jgi:hypothetical protein
MLTKLLAYRHLKYDNYHSERVMLNLVKKDLQLSIFILNYYY